MLNIIPTSINEAARRVVLANPNGCTCSVYRKRTTRQDAPPGTMGGAPTYGGLGVLDSEDEFSFEVDFVGHGIMVPTEPYQGQGAKLTDRQDLAVDGIAEFRFLIEPEYDPGEAGWFDLKSRDYVIQWLGEAVKIGFEVVAIEPRINIPPYAAVYVCNRRDDLDYIDLGDN